MKADRPAGRGRILIYRHGPIVRLTHWINAACILVLLLSGLQILCAHPAFYWGDTSRFADPAAAIVTTTNDDGETRGALRMFGRTFDTTGVLGASRTTDGQMVPRAVPAWATLPAELDLGAGRRWHFFFAWIFVLNGMLYVAQGLASGRVRRTLIPGRADLAHLGRAIADHARLRLPHGEEARRYNVLQKLSYLPVVFGLLPLMILTGLAMSPAVNALLPWLTVMLGGRQSARFLHFLAAGGLVLFVLVHIAMVVLAGPLNELRSMITGWFAIRPEPAVSVEERAA
jgi:thiosulfate reductase cytochrome b subunit